MKCKCYYRSCDLKYTMDKTINDEFFSIWVSFICFMYMSYIGHVVSFHLEQSMPSRLGLWPDWQQIHNRLLANHSWSINWLIDISLYLVTINKLTVFSWVVSTNLSDHHGVIATLVLHSLQVMFSSYPL